MDINNICLVCLSKASNMKDITKTENTKPSLQEMYNSIIKIKVNIQKFPSNLCDSCEIDLTASYTFQQNCLKSIQVLQESTTSNPVFDLNYSIKSEEINLEEDVNMIQDIAVVVKTEMLDADDANYSLDQVSNFRNEVYVCENQSFQPNSERVDPVDSAAKKVKTTGKRISQLYPAERIREAIDMFVRSHEADKECSFCNFIAGDRRTLIFHTVKAHKDVSARWCVVCRKEVDNLQKHMYTHNKCEFCNKMCRSKVAVICHLQNHSVDKPYSCEKCSKTFTKKDALQFHHNNAHPDSKEVIRSESSLEILSAEQLSTSDQSVLDEGVDAVKNVKSTNYKKLELYPEEQVHQAIELYLQKHEPDKRCSFCDYIASDRRSLLLHTTHIHKEISDRWCVLCRVEVENLDKHTYEHNKCEFCNLVFKSKTSLIVHLQCHSVVRQYHCNLCDEGFTRKESLERHNRKLHPDLKEVIDTKSSSVEILISEPSIYVKEAAVDQSAELQETKVSVSQKNVNTQLHLCMECGKQLSTNTSLKRHMTIHTGATPYKCSFCEKVFSTNACKAKHERIHSDERPFVCDVCGKSFKYSPNLCEHKKLHAGVRDHPCLMCDKRFYTSTHARVHMKEVHIGVRRYECNMCDKSYFKKGRLIDHQSIHSDLKPFKCSYCNATFKLSKCLKVHLATHDDSLRHKCSHCDFSTPRKFMLRRHIEKKHPEHNTAAME